MSETPLGPPTRAQIDQAIENKDFAAAHAQLATLFRAMPSLANAQLVLDRLGKIERPIEPSCCRVAFLRSFTIEPVVPLIRAYAALYGVDIKAHAGDFNAYAQEILNPTSSLYAFEPDVVVLAVQARDLTPALWDGFADLDKADAANIVDETVNTFRSLIAALRQRSQAHLIVHNLEQPAFPSAGIYDAQATAGQRAAIAKINAGLSQIAAEHTGVYVLDYDCLVARHGRERWFDERKWLTARLPIAADCLAHLAGEYLRFVLPLTGRVCKALVVDLDNTLWGGVIGEDGMAGIQVGPEYPGAFYQHLQRVLLDLAQRGIILAVASKNNRDDALEALENHPGMLVRPKHFAALRIDWADKAHNLRQIASELNIGLDAVAFLDDNPVERERVQTELPQVSVIDLPADPAGYAAALRQCPLFERVSLSSEDRERGRLYSEQRQRVELQQSAGSLEDFYRSLRMVARICPANAQTLSRVAQLTQKTNQLNTTTRRYSEQQISEMMANPDWRVFTVAVSDRFGDNGLVGVAILRITRAECEIDTFLLSCRVIGRTIETAMLARLAQEAKALGMATLQGWFAPTKKNAPAEAIYAAHGFTAQETQDGATLWQLDLAGAQIACPEWISLSEAREDKGQTGGADA